MTTQMFEQRGWLADRVGRPSRTKEPGRVCAEDGCSTVLSIYNPQDFCSPHARLRLPPDRHWRGGHGRPAGVSNAEMRERNEDIRRMASLGISKEVIGGHFGLDPLRVSQIVRG